MALLVKTNASLPIASKVEIQGFLDSIKEISYKNEGGCLFFCYAFWLWLKKNKFNTLSFGIIQHEIWGSSSTKQNEKFIKGETDIATSSSHFVWTYNGIQYDAESVDPSSFNGATVTELKGLQNRYGSLVKEFCENSLKHGCWNPMFNRKEAVKIVRKNLKLNMNSTIKHMR